MNGKQLKQKIYQKEYYDKRKTDKRFKIKRKKQHQNWYKKNRGKVNKIEKKYYEKHKDEILKRAKNNLEYKQRQKDRRVLERKEKPWVQHLYSARARCNNPKLKSYKNYGGRGIKCYLTREDIKFLWLRDKAWLLKKPSIDKKDNNWHYVLDNCRFIEFIDNVKKGNLDRVFKTTLDYTI